MTEGWDALSLGDLAVFRAGGSFPKRAQGNESGDLPFIKVGDLSLPTNGHSIRTARNWVSYAVAEKLKAKAFPPGSAVFAKIGEGLKSERVRLLGQETLLDNNLMGAIPKADTCEEKFLFYLLQTVGLASVAGGSALPYLRQSDLEKIPVRVPPLEEQRRVAGVLGALDDLIQVNMTLAAKLEQIVLCEFEREGFGAEGLVRLDRLVEVGPTYPVPRGNVRFVEMPALSTQGSGIAYLQTRPKATGTRFRNGDTLLARITPSLENGKTAFVDALDDQETACGSTEFIVMKARDGVPPEWVYSLARNTRFRSHAVKSMTGTSGRQRVSPDAVRSFSVNAPNKQSLDSFGQFAKPLFMAMREYRLEVEALTGTRDELLPLLLSGRVRVGEVAA